MRILTVDLEDWFHLLAHPGYSTPEDWSLLPTRLEKNVEFLLQCFDEKSLKATFFCLGWVAKRYPKLIRKIVKEGHSVACHSDSHQLIWEQTPDQFLLDLKTAKIQIEDASGSKVCAYRAPGFSLTRKCVWALDCLLEVGIEVDCSIFPARHSHGGISDFPYNRPCLVKTAGGGEIIEFPMSFSRFFGKNLVVSGGGYFRFFPYSVIKHLIRDSEYVMTYFHPRDFDPGQPVVGGLSMTRRFKSYYGLKGSKSKLSSLLNDFDFLDVPAACSKIRRESLDVIHL